jgi:hypothetical protein
LCCSTPRSQSFHEGGRADRHTPKTSTPPLPPRPTFLGVFFLASSSFRRLSRWEGKSAVPG